MCVGGGHNVYYWVKQYVQKNALHFITQCDKLQICIEGFHVGGALFRDWQELICHTVVKSTRYKSFLI